MEEEWEHSLTAREVHTPPRGGFSASGFAGFALIHLWPKRWEAGGADMVGSYEGLIVILLQTGVYLYCLYFPKIP
jgi:hypothetical protein